METHCPACGEVDKLTGTPTADDIEVTCHACGHRWLRGRPRCRTCGGEDVVRKLQLMTRTPRGNQLAVVGHREVPLCPQCDQDILDVESEGRTLPEGYVSRFVFGPDAQRAKPPATARPQPVRPRPTGSPPATPAQAKVSKAPQRPQSPRHSPPESPTVRQAVDEAMNEKQGIDPVTMLLLGRHLGAATRLKALDAPSTAAALQQWFESTWGEQGADRRAAAPAALL
jgi:hypothetical protein